MALPKAFALYSAICARYDLEPRGPTYAEQEVIRALEAAAPSQPAEFA